MCRHPAGRQSERCARSHNFLEVQSGDHSAAMAALGYCLDDGIDSKPIYSGITGSYGFGKTFSALRLVYFATRNLQADETPKYRPVPCDVIMGRSA